MRAAARGPLWTRAPVFNPTQRLEPVSTDTVSMEAEFNVIVDVSDGIDVEQRARQLLGQSAKFAAAAARFREHERSVIDELTAELEFEQQRQKPWLVRAHEAARPQLRGDFDPAALPWTLPAPQTGSRWSTNTRKHEDEGFLRTAKMPQAYTSPKTGHVPVLHYELDQLRRAADVDSQRHLPMHFPPVHVPVAAGPSPFGGIGHSGADQRCAGKPTRRDRGLSAAPDPSDPADVHDTDWPAWPATMAELFTDPADWDTITDWYEAYGRELQRVERGYTFRYGRIPGGKDGITVPAEAIKPEFRRFIWWNNNGKPEWVRDRLPDGDTEVDVTAIYRDCVRAGVNDIEVVSGIALYGIKSNSALSSDTVLMPNYKSAFEHLGVLQEVAKGKIEDFGDFPRLTTPRLEAQHVPARVLPKGVVVQLKANGKIKYRGTIDGGAKRMRQLLMTRLLDSMMDRVNGMQGKSPAGADSPNGAMQLDKYANFEWGSVDIFARQLDILNSSGEPVDVVLFDFRSYYEEWPRSAAEQWWHEEFVSSAGGSVAGRGSFGIADLPNILNRQNFAVLELIQKALDEEQRKFPADRIPANVQAWMLQRELAGESTAWTCMLGFFDDNSFGCFSMNGEWTAVVRRVAQQVWARYRMRLSDEKTEIMHWGAADMPPILGREVSVAERMKRLSREKQQQYGANIDEIIAAAEAADNPKNLVTKEAMQQLLGRLLFGMMSGIPTMWPDFLVLLACLATNWSPRLLRLHAEARDILRHMQWRLHHENGTASTPYTLRPLQDGLPVWVTFTDAGLRGQDGHHTRAGYGGWIWLYGSDRIQYFHGEWDISAIDRGRVDINELETLAQEYAADLVAEWMDGEEHYLYAIGDSGVHFGNVLSKDKMSSAGLRFLYRQRSDRAWLTRQLVCTLHVTREWNCPADSLANGVEQKFTAEIRELMGEGVTLERMELAPGRADLGQLVDFKLRAIAKA